MPELCFALFVKLCENLGALMPQLFPLAANPPCCALVCVMRRCANRGPGGGGGRADLDGMECDTSEIRIRSQPMKRSIAHVGELRAIFSTGLDNDERWPMACVTGVIW